MEKKLEILAQSQGISIKRTESIIRLIDDGATLPFMARYRKEATGGLDEVQLGSFIDELNRLNELEKRKKSILKSIDEQGKLTPELSAQIEACWDLSTLEDIYLPYKSKRKTKADVAIEAGLLPLAKQIMAQNQSDLEAVVLRTAPSHLDYEEALAGAKHIIAEWVNERIALRNHFRKAIEREGQLVSKLKRGKDASTEEAQTYLDYHSHSESVRRVPSHRFLAMRRGEKVGVLSLSIEISDHSIENALNRFIVKGSGELSAAVLDAGQDAWKRLLLPSLSSEVFTELDAKAQEAAIDVFALNLEPLLLQPPVGNVRTLAIDPGFRTGCKVVCLDEYGRLLHNETIYPHPPQKEWAEAQKKLRTLVSAYKIQAISIGNGTAGRETEQLVRNTRFDSEIQVYVVNEDGASIYSASKIARAEFPDKDVTVRGAVSIGRRLQDPLAELVKIEPQHIGVGQYQHDLNPKRLEERLSRVVEKCVNAVGVELNSASASLLEKVAGLGPSLSTAIVNYRNENGAFKSRKDLLKVPRLGAKAYEQAAGFLRVSNSENILDTTGVHPERYALVTQIARSVKLKPADVVRNSEAIRSINWSSFTSDDVGLPTLEDIKNELLQPARDPRGSVKVFEFANIRSISELSIGMELPGIVTNLTDFGAFVDLGIKQNGLIHISRLKDGYVAHPSEVLQVQNHVKVRVEEVDERRNRIGLRLIDRI
ncbi:Tex family protein [Phaeocystidibacter luteus]|uniref:RNA-binding transcriptional accessory protein n=1 Tax=Phaeocystidibacter luteus TaxID=911197 RepID=A0A6N6RK33_9FLAO|nr:Tex family protein [Phaeocystidibacter luteus]KAB2814168.1 RNA-binding transcriptional accessory protein [Phaeocystidibacter luteus]